MKQVWKEQRPFRGIVWIRYAVANEGGCRRKAGGCRSPRFLWARQKFPTLTKTKKSRKHLERELEVTDMLKLTMAVGEWLGGPVKA